ncbi:MAG: acylneuraminate cytidylyltransferase family protein [Parafilimonas sp.]
MKILGIIPARGGSKGIPGKNIKLLGGKPLLAYTANAAAQAKLLNEIMISSDSKDIIEVAEKYQIKAPFIRPANLADDTTPTVDVIKHALNFYHVQKIYFDAVCVLQPTYPFREKGFIDACIEKFISAGADTLISVVPVPHQYNPHWVFEKNDDGYLISSTNDKKIISRRQDLPEAFIRDGSVYVIKTDTIINDKNIFAAKITYQLSSPEWYVNIDTPDDWKLAEDKAEKY